MFEFYTQLDLVAAGITRRYNPNYVQAEPHYATRGAAGLDLTADLDQPRTLLPGRRALIATGLYLTMPKGVEMQIRSKSGLALSKGIIVLNAPATIDSDYKDEVGVVLYNASDEPYHVQPGQKIAQGVFGMTVQPLWGFTDKTTERQGGYGSTGL